MNAPNPYTSLVSLGNTTITIRIRSYQSRNNTSRCPPHHMCLPRCLVRSRTSANPSRRLFERLDTDAPSTRLYDEQMARAGNRSLRRWVQSDGRLYDLQCTPATRRERSAWLCSQFFVHGYLHRLEIVQAVAMAILRAFEMMRQAQHAVSRPQLALHNKLGEIHPKSELLFRSGSLGTLLDSAWNIWRTFLHDSVAFPSPSRSLSQLSDFYWLMKFVTRMQQGINCLFGLSSLLDAQRLGDVAGAFGCYI